MYHVVNAIVNLLNPISCHIHYTKRLFLILYLINNKKTFSK